MSTNNRQPNVEVLTRQTKTVRHRIIDVAGLAGSGKTSFTQTLLASTDNIMAGQRFRPFRPRDTLLCVSHGMSNLFHLFGYALRGKLTREQSKWLLYLQSWGRVLERQRERHRTNIVIDQGPLFYMATLHAFGPSDFVADHSWWNRVYRQWSATLDVIVLLDAPNTTLQKRINGRSKPHFVQGLPTQDVFRFFSAYRDSYEYVISRLEDCGSIQVHRIDGSHHSLDCIVEEFANRFCEET